MMRFDFLHTREPLRIPEIPLPWRGFALVALACVTVLFGVCRIEAVRLSAAVSLESAYEQRLAQTERVELRRSAAYKHLRAAIAVLHAAADLAKTAQTQARLVTVLVQALPPHVWLTAVRHDETGLTVQGKASELPALADLIRNLSASRTLGRPQLTSVTRPGNAPAAAPLTYALHVDVAAQS